MRELYLRLTVPDELDPEEIVETMCADFYYGNRDFYEERFPNQDIMSQINVHIVRGEVNVLAQ